MRAQVVIVHALITYSPPPVVTVAIIARTNIPAPAWRAENEGATAALRNTSGTAALQMRVGPVTTTTRAQRPLALQRDPRGRPRHLLRQLLTATARVRLPVRRLFLQSPRSGARRCARASG